MMENNCSEIFFSDNLIEKGNSTWKKSMTSPSGRYIPEEKKGHAVPAGDED